MSRETLEMYQSLSPEDRQVVDIVIYTLLARRTVQRKREPEPEIGFNALLIALAKARGERR